MTDFEELISGFDFTYSQQNELEQAYDDNPAGFARIAKRTQTANNPPAAFLAGIRKGQHMLLPPEPAAQKVRATIDEAVAFGVGLYRARIAKYPPTDEKGWTLDDAIGYAVDGAASKHSAYAPNDIERQLRIEIDHPWTADSDPALGTGCPPEIYANIMAKLGKIGAMPDPKPIVAPDPDPVVERTLAERLLEMAGKAA